MLLTLASIPLRTTRLQACALYDGPETPSLSNVYASIELEESGLVVEVADSLVADGGRGLFVRLADGAQPVTLDKGTPFCGYAQGAMEQSADAAGGKTVAFQLRSVDAAVFFEGELRSARACLEGYRLESGAVSGIVGHTEVRDDAGALVGLEIDPTQRQYFVPAPEQPSPTIMTLGQYANDLAVGGGNGEQYEERAASENMLVLVQRLERDPETPSTLRPSRPIPTLGRTVTISNSLPMEVGCRYGGRYWGGD